MIVNTLSFLGGWLTGSNYAWAKTKEDEVKQGKGYYISSQYQTAQVYYLGKMVSVIASEHIKSFLYRFPVQILASIVLPAAYFPLALLGAAVKQGHYEKNVKKIIESYPPIAEEVRSNIQRKRGENSKWILLVPKTLSSVPERLGNKTVKIINFMVEHNGDIFRVAMMAGAVALISLGKTYFGSAILASVTYEAIDRMGFVPRKISLFMEVYMPGISLLGTVLSKESWVIRMIALVNLSTFLFNSPRRLCYQKIDLLAHKYVPYVNSPTLQEIDAPVVINRELTFEEINEILDDNDWGYEINPAHCSKWVSGLSDFPDNEKFDQYLTFFNGIDWVNKYNLLKDRLKEDENFINFLEKNIHSKSETSFPLSKEEIKALFFDETFTEIGEISKEQYVANWLKEQMEILVSVLAGKKRVKGSQKDLVEAIGYSSKILAYLESIREIDQIEFEDILLKLAIEGGDYCARGIKRATSELTNNILQRGLSQYQDENPMRNYELKIERALQDKRMELIQEAYQKIVKDVFLNKGVLDENQATVALDTHGFDMYRQYLSLGVYPLTDYERNDFGIQEFLNWSLTPGFVDLRCKMYQDYSQSLNYIIKENGNTDFVVYIRQIIMSNSKLSQEQKDLILEKYSEGNNKQWAEIETNRRFYRLLFAMLGVSRPESSKEIFNPRNDKVVQFVDYSLYRIKGFVDKIMK